MTLRDRLKKSRKLAGKTQAEVAEAVKMSQPAYQALESGKNQKSAFLPQIAQFLGVDIIWLTTGTENSNAKITDTEVHVYDEQDPVPDGFTAIDYYDEIFVSAGYGHLNIEKPSPKKFLVPTSLLYECNVDSYYAKVVKVRGESMVPDLLDGQRISVDISAKRIFDGEIYAFQVGDDTKVKYLFNWNEQGVGGFKAVSRNEDKLRFPDEYYSPSRIESEGIFIIGQYWMKLDTRKIRR
ncbi:XRE family transcriptional regulator [Acinetobacter courvalinii]|uniref:XRE family transcriptional regulator n=1 Tax=Acinetobacter courvalinii TaxID=280147 RepID=UPI0021CF0A36|nr:S24 family peptidase [Acinetobacter courvalinii]MCU4367544.1 helix-turn-helix domain-containing protein [Acinetobacter courvalinii]MCU4445750.1 helix-turn-helix domain-containing protein [Acinetobacter courvalinii]